MEPVLVFSMVIVLVLATIVVWRLDHVRARWSRVEPTQHVKQLTRDDLQSRLVEFCRGHHALETHFEHGHLYVTWRLSDVYEEKGEPPEMTYSLELRVGSSGTVYARYGQGHVSWVRTDDAKFRHPTVEWDWDMAPDFGRFEPGRTIPEPTEHSPHTVDGLVLPIRKIVLEAGWAWQPVLEMPIEDSVATPPRNVPKPRRVEVQAQ